MSADGIHCLVFSKDRAMQLDAFLRSARRYAPYASITVLAVATDDEHAETYDELWDLLPGRIIREDRGEESFEWWLRTLLRDEISERVVFHTDDDVFFRLTWLPPTHWQAVHSMRLGSNTVHCHPTGRTQTPPLPLETQLLWRWEDEEGDFGYPLSLNGTVYRPADLLLLLDFEFANPSELEAGLAARAGRFVPQWMTAPLHSCCVSLPHNRVSASSGCPAGSNPEWQPEALRERFMAGWRIDLEAMDFGDVRGAHQEIPLMFRRLHTRP